MGYRLGVDVGGTFTDLLLIDEESGATHRAKVPSTPGDPSIAVLQGIDLITQRASVDPGELSQVMHGTTVATNAVLEGKGAKVGLVVTEGYRQILQVARSFVPGGLAGWIVWPKPEPLASLENTIEVKERIDARGQVIRHIDQAALRQELERLRTHAIEALTISLMNSFTNDEHELEVARLAEEIFPDIPISLSSKILPEIKEYERTLTTVANSYVRPRASQYLNNLSSELGRRAPGARLHILRSDGGLMGLEVASAAPVNMLMSGPAGGVSGAVWIASQAGYSDLLTFDMGGTSTDVALVQQAIPKVGRETSVGDLTIRASSIDVRTVGAGGGSIAHVPALTKALRVGPQSAGADPGPAAYGRGGIEPTVTDANMVLGYLPSGLLDGEMGLDGEAARGALEPLAEALGIEVERAASGVIDIVNENMFGALRLVSVQQGYDPRDFALVAFGGAGPLHANALGRLMGSWPVIVPPSPGVLCAFGDATTRLRSESSHTYIRRFSEVSSQQVLEELERLRIDAAAELVSQGVAESDQEIGYSIDMRYHGQGFEVTIDVDPAMLTDELLDQTRAKFEAEHERLFTFALDQECELVHLRAIAQGARPKVEALQIEVGDEDASSAVIATKEIYVEGERAPAKIYARSRLRANNRIPGPAIVSEMDSTTLVLPGHEARVDAYGNLIINPVV
ncbi:hydantoinase/oxoprolinase family protein [Ferrimicrobium acidiphilum]|uniref:hydantoinase/oxoprolinase family protein n=1 Tax=Ferrimicrobium acidiphilum TaxID=121039 RepID=UPI0023F300E1|nr:hydantoinase/oxoprolinase family protein [Ferrimicrobium acidiphilum]